MNNYTISITLLLMAFSSVQAAPAQSGTLVGSVVRYDASMSLHTSQADLVLKVKTKGAARYVRLRYAPNGFGFDAPPARLEHILPKEMFSDGTLVWAFRVHAPHNHEEESACTARAEQYAPGEKGQLVEIERFVSVPRQDKESIPRPESLSCSIIEAWTKNNDERGTSQ